jgi:hypothetical protein
VPSPHPTKTTANKEAGSSHLQRKVRVFIL